jgi:hypothetical protein
MANPFSESGFFYEVARAVDSLLNTLWRDQYWKRGQTLSQHAGIHARNGSRAACIFCKLLHLFEREHCERSLAGD